MKKYEKLCEVILAKGLLNAYMKGGKVKGVCPKCGTMVPKYPGQDVIWCTTSSIDTGNLPAKGF